ncbi:hypothetical protein JCM8115_001778 [Rhodotorula mucilaginosa]
MEWTDSWSVAANADHPARGDKSVPQTPRDNLLSPTSRSPAPLHKYNAGAVSEWLETAALDSNFSLDDDRMLDDDVVRGDSMDVDAGSPDTDNGPGAETRRKNSLGLALDLRDLKSLILSCSVSDGKGPLSRPYPSPVSPATTLFLRSNVSPATSSATSEADSYFDYQRPRQLSNATSVHTSNYGGDDDEEQERRKAERALPPSPELVPLSLPPIPATLPELPPAPAVAPAPSHPLHRAHRLSMTPVGATPSHLELSSVPESTQPPSIVDLPPVSLSGAAETGLHPQPPTPPRSPRAHLRMLPLPAFEASSTAMPSQLVSPTTRATRPLAPADSLFQQSSKRQRRL